MAVLAVVAAGGGAAWYFFARPHASPVAAPARTADPTNSDTSGTDPSPEPSTAAASPTASPSAITAAQDFTSLYKRVSDGVVRIETTACDGGGVGSGFLVAPTMVATVAHVVDGATNVIIREGGTTTTGTVVGIDPDAEVALVRTSEPLDGHVFDLDTSQPDVGTDIGAIGYPLGGPESLTKGAVSGLGRGIDLDSGHLAGLIQTDAAINPGNSGGPLLTADGIAVGLVEAKNTAGDNIGFAIPGQRRLQPTGGLADEPAANLRRAGLLGPDRPQQVNLDVTDRSGHPDGPGLASAFGTYADGINSGDYENAYDILSPGTQSRVPFAKFSDGVTSSYIVDFAINEVTSLGDRDKVDVEFTSVQDPTRGGHNQACSNWNITYTMTQSAGLWRIDKSSPHAGSPNSC